MIIALTSPATTYISVRCTLGQFGDGSATNIIGTLYLKTRGLIGLEPKGQRPANICRNSKKRIDIGAAHRNIRIKSQLC